MGVNGELEVFFSTKCKHPSVGILLLVSGEPEPAAINSISKGVSPFPLLPVNKQGHRAT